jgi:hypothetical protein
MTLIVQIALGILLALAILWLLYKLFNDENDEPGNHPP